MGTAALWHYVYTRFGDAAGDRVWGAGLLITAVLLMFLKALPLSIGSVQTTLTGRRGLYVLLPAALFGLVVALFPHEAACALHFRHRVCP
jgi:hypothetical protein